MIKLDQKQIEKTKGFSEEFRQKYLDTDRGKEHIHRYLSEIEEVNEIYKKIREKYQKDKNITNDLLYHLLPYQDTKFVRQKGYRASTWPAIIKDVKKWFEGAGWQKRENWNKVSKEIFLLIENLIFNKNNQATKDFSRSVYSKGFQAGMISPIFYCLDQNLLVINKKTVDTINFIANTNLIDSRLDNYLENVKKINELLKKLDLEIFNDYRNFDAFCHWMCDKRLGGYARLKEPEEPAPPEEIVEISCHEDAIGVLLELGNLFGYVTYTAHPSKNYNDKKLKEFATIHEIPEYVSGIKGVTNIDVIWFSKQKDQSSLFFEVEDKGTMREALHKLYQVIMLKSEIFIISPIENRSKFEKWVDSEPFRELRSTYKFRSYEELAKFFIEAKNYYKIRDNFLREE